MRLAVLGALLVAACTPRPADPITLCEDPNARTEDGGFVDGGFPAGGGVPAAPPEPVHPVGRPIALTLGVALTPRCVGQQVVAQQVLSEVLDGAGLPVEHTAAAPRSLGGIASTVVSFVPQTAGTYYVKARFEPDLGAAQRLVEVAEATTAVLLDELPTTACDSVALLPSRAVVCFTNTEVVVRRGGVEVQRLPLTVRAWLSAGRALWLDDDTTRRRLLDVGAGPLVESGARGRLLGSAATVFATEDTFFSVDPQQPYVLLRQALTGDVLEETVLSIAPPSGGLVLAPTMGLALADGSLAIANLTGFACQLALPPPGDLTASVLRCDRLPGFQRVTAVGGGRFWLQQQEGPIDVALPQPGGLRAERLLARGNALLACDAKGLPAVRSEDGRHLLLPRLSPALHPVVVAFPRDLGEEANVGEATLAVRSADGLKYLFFSW